MNLSDFAAAMEATWPPQALHRAGPWAVRQGAGGGKRVSAASPVGDWRADDIALAEQAQAGLGQDSLFVIWPWDQAERGCNSGDGVLQQIFVSRPQVAGYL